jgi:PBSX family phage terminase large subunit
MALLSRLTPRQREVFREFAEGKMGKINIFCGAVASGKTYVSLIIFAFFVANSAKNDLFAISGYSIKTIELNCLNFLRKFWGKYCDFSLGNQVCTLFGRRVYIRSGGLEGSDLRLRGATLKGVYIDEVAAVSEKFFEEALRRLRVAGAKLFAATNPDRPNHWLLKKYIQNPEIDLKYYEFRLEDNIFLPAEFVRHVKKANTGVNFERFVLGNWVGAENAIYKIFSDNKANFLTSTPPKNFDYINVGVDFGGNRSAHAFVCTGIAGNQLFALQSQKMDAKGVNPAELQIAVKNFCEKIVRAYGRIDCIYCDSAEQTLINGLRAALPFAVKNASKKPITDRIRATLALMGLERFQLLQGECASLENALENALYSQKSLVDERLDDGTSDIDSLDAFEYSFEKFMKMLIAF